MGKRYRIILFLFFTANMVFAESNLDSLLVNLDQTILQHEIYKDRREARIRELKGKATKTAPNSIAAYQLNDSIYREYKSYMCDSAVLYLTKNIRIARNLRDQEKETACFGVLGDQKGIFIEQAQGHHTFRFVLSPGKPFELHCSAPGKAIMAYLPNTVRDYYLAQMEFTRYNARTITTPEAYMEELEKVRRQGYAMDNEEELSGVVCVGTPIFNYTSYPCGAIWISGPKDRLSKEVIRQSVEYIKDTAQCISRELGYSHI